MRKEAGGATSGAATRVSLTVTEEEAGRRLDQFLAEKGAVPSRTAGQKLIDEGRVRITERSPDAGRGTGGGGFASASRGTNAGRAIQVKASYKVSAGDVVEVEVPPVAAPTVEPEEIDLDILYEDADVIVVNKPAGMVVHPAAGNWSGTLVNALLAHCKDLSGIGGVTRPGIVHRLDKDTSGVLMAAKNDFAHQSLTKQIKDRAVVRKYLALVHGRFRGPQGIISGAIGRHPVDRQKMTVREGGRHAVTHYRVLEEFGNYTLIEARLETGRTHQIRVHMAHIGHPVVGDPKYGPRHPHLGLKGQALHAATLGFVHPRTGKYLEFTAPPPPEMQEVIDKLRVSHTGGH